MYFIEKHHGSRSHQSLGRVYLPKVYGMLHVGSNQESRSTGDGNEGGASVNQHLHAVAVVDDGLDDEQTFDSRAPYLREARKIYNER